MRWSHPDLRVDSRKLDHDTMSAQDPSALRSQRPNEMARDTFSSPAPPGASNVFPVRFCYVRRRGQIPYDTELDEHHPPSDGATVFASTSQEG